jgi:hypothetical protein
MPTRPDNSSDAGSDAGICSKWGQRFNRSADCDCLLLASRQHVRTQSKAGCTSLKPGGESCESTESAFL